MKIPNIRDFHVHDRNWVAGFLEEYCDHLDKKCWIKLPKHGRRTVSLVAHIDTAHEKGFGEVRRWNPLTYEMEDIESSGKSNGKEVFLDRTKAVLWAPEGLGADDRAGVYSIIHIYESMPDELKPTLIFCDEEESGGAGAKQVAEVYGDVLDDSLFLVGLDRRNPTDVVFYNDEPEVFTKFIESFGFEKTKGTFTDVTTLGRRAKICAANLSCGFYNEHTKHEFLRIAELHATIEKTRKIIERAVTEQLAYPNPNIKETPIHYGGYGMLDNSGWELNWKDNWVRDTTTGAWRYKAPGDRGGNGKGKNSDNTVVRRDASLVGLDGKPLTFSRKERRKLRREQRLAELQVVADKPKKRGDDKYTAEDYARNPYLAELSYRDRMREGGP